jgi:dTDP-glucose 4,6-dehydratase
VCYVNDLVEGIYRLLMSEDNYPVNIGNPDEVTMLELAKEILELIPESKSQIVFKELPQDDPRVRQPDITLAKQLLGWTPTIDRKEGLKRTLAYFRTAVQNA